MKDITFGQYYPVDSVIHRLDPRIKIILCIAYVVLLFLVKNFEGLILIFLFLITVIALSKVALRSILNSLKGLLFLILFTFVLNLFFHNGETDTVLLYWQPFPYANWFISGFYVLITKEGLIFAVRMLIRLTFLMVGTSLLTLTTTPVELSDAIESLLSPLKIFKFSPHTLALIMSIALSFIPTLMNDTERIMKAQKARGANLDTGSLLKRAKALIPVLIPLFVSAFTRASELADAMNARCYNGDKGRTKMKVLKLKLKDYIALAVMVLMFTAILVWVNKMNFIIL